MLFDNVEKSLPRNPIFSKGRKLRNSQDSTRLEMSTWTMLRTCRPLGTPRHGTGQGRAWQGRSNAIDEVCGRPIDGFSADKFITIVPQSCDRGEHYLSALPGWKDHRLHRRRDLPISIQMEERQRATQNLTYPARCLSLIHSLSTRVANDASWR